MSTALAPRIEHGLLVPMRDDARLSLDLLRPEGADPLPVVLVRTPYDKVAERGHRADLYGALLRAGYAVALQDCRGRFNSDGVFFPYFHEADDGYDSVEWVASQPWCDGRVGMVGHSYSAQAAWYAASRSPPHLRAIAPVVSPPASLFRNEPIAHGAFMLAMGEWMVAMGRRSWQDPDALDRFTDVPPPYLVALPLAGLPAAAGVSSPWWDEMMRHPTYDDFWRRGAYDDWERIAVPALNVSGWYDMNFPGAPTSFAAMRARGGSDAAREGQRLVIGPWPHAVNQQRALDGIDFGEAARIALDDMVVAFFDRWLGGRGERPGPVDDARVRVFVMGANEWWVRDAWPLADAQPTPLYLRAGGGLSFERPGEEPPDGYRYDPADPVRVPWRIGDGPVDDAPLAARADVLLYTSEPLDAPLDVVGPVACELHAASSARDTDWHVRLADVHPDGTARFLCQGVLRARFRESFEAPTLLHPGRPERFGIDMDATGIRLLPGHRLRLAVTSSWAGRWDRNTNSGAESNFLDDTLVVAEQTVFHERGRASHVVLPVVRR